MGDGLLTLRDPERPLAWLGDLLGLAAGLMWALTTVVLRTTSPAKQLLYQVDVSAATLPLLSMALGERWSLQFSAFARGSVLTQALIGAFASYLVWM